MAEVTTADFIRAAGVAESQVEGYTQLAEQEVDFRTPPTHYTTESGMQPWDVVDAFGLGYYGGNALKYLLRAGKKESRVEDLEKAVNYIKKMIADEVD